MESPDHWPVFEKGYPDYDAVNRDSIMAENDILRKNVKDLQEQLQQAYKRIAELTKDKQ